MSQGPAGSQVTVDPVTGKPMGTGGEVKTITVDDRLAKALEKHGGDVGKFLDSHEELGKSYGKATEELGKLRKQSGAGEGKTDPPLEGGASDLDFALSETRGVVIDATTKSVIDGLKKGNNYYELIADDFRKSLKDDSDVAARIDALTKTPIAHVRSATEEVLRYAFFKVASKNLDKIVEARQRGELPVVEQSDSAQTGGTGGKAKPFVAQVLEDYIKDYNSNEGL